MEQTSGRERTETARRRRRTGRRAHRRRSETCERPWNRQTDGTPCAAATPSFPARKGASGDAGSPSHNVRQMAEVRRAACVAASQEGGKRIPRGRSSASHTKTETASGHRRKFGSPPNSGQTARRRSSGRRCLPKFAMKQRSRGKRLPHSRKPLLRLEGGSDRSGKKGRPTDPENRKPPPTEPLRQGRNRETEARWRASSGGAGGSRTRVQTGSPKAFYTLSRHSILLPVHGRRQPRPGPSFFVSPAGRSLRRTIPKEMIPRMNSG